MLLTVSGPPGSGKSTVAAGLADALGYTHTSGGDIFRQLADERGLSLAAFNELAESNDRIDRDLDRRLRRLAAEENEVILESRLSGWMAAEHADLRIWLDAPMEVRARRIADRESKDIALARDETDVRERSERKRYLEYYGIDIGDLGIYDLVVNTARWGPTETLDLLVEAVNTYDFRIDEGKFPVDRVRYEF